MNSLIPAAWAQAGGASTSSQFAPVLMMVVFVAIFYFLLPEDGTAGFVNAWQMVPSQIG